MRWIRLGLVLCFVAVLLFVSPLPSNRNEALGEVAGEIDTDEGPIRIVSLYNLPFFLGRILPPRLSTLRIKGRYEGHLPYGSQVSVTLNGVPVQVPVSNMRYFPRRRFTSLVFFVNIHQLQVMPGDMLTVTILLSFIQKEGASYELEGVKTYRVVGPPARKGGKPGDPGGPGEPWDPGVPGVPIAPVSPP